MTRPLDVAKYIPNPCSTLTSAQLHELGVTKPGEVDRDAVTSTCSMNPAVGVAFTIQFNIDYGEGQPQGLANAYYNANGPSFQQNILKRLPDIDGVPAVTEPMQNTKGDCYIYLGATDQLSYAAGVTGDPDDPAVYDNACSFAQKLATDATETMRSGK